MPYCSKCGVRVNEDIDSCPLYHIPIQKFESKLEKDAQKYPFLKYKVSLSNRQKRFITRVILTIIFIIGFLTVLTTNLMQSGNLKWAGYPMVAIGGAWLISTLLLFLFKTPLLIISGNFIVLSGLLALIDIIDGKLQWYLLLGLPVVGMIAMSALILYLFYRFAKNMYAVLVSLNLMIIIAICFGINLLVSAYEGNVKISWALYVAVSIGPISILLIIYHFYLRKVLDLKKVFHF